MRRHVLSIAFLFLLSAPLSANADDRATAQQLFHEGRALMAAGKTAEACEKFEGAAELSQTIGVRLNLGECYAKLGKLATAWSKFDEALTIAERTGDVAAANIARNRVAALSPLLSYLTVSVAKSAAIAGLEIRRDGERIPSAAWETALPLDSGKHVVKATAPGHISWTSDVEVSATEKRRLSVPQLLSESSSDDPGNGSKLSPGSPISPAPSSDAESHAGSWFTGAGGGQHIVAVTATALGVVALGLGTYFGVEMLSDRRAYTSYGAACSGSRTCVNQSHNAVHEGNIATAGFIVGGALAASGLALLLVPSPAREKGGTAVSIVPAVGPEGGTLSVSGRF